MIYVAIPLRPVELERLRELAADVARAAGHPATPPTVEATAAALLRAALTNPVAGELLERLTASPTREGTP